jgi:hypothetical protein
LSFVNGSAILISDSVTKESLKYTENWLANTGDSSHTPGLSCHRLNSPLKPRPILPPLHQAQWKKCEPGPAVFTNYLHSKGSSTTSLALLWSDSYSKAANPTRKAGRVFSGDGNPLESY